MFIDSSYLPVLLYIPLLPVAWLSSVLQFRCYAVAAFYSFRWPVLVLRQERTPVLCLLLLCLLVRLSLAIRAEPPFVDAVDRIPAQVIHEPVERLLGARLHYLRAQIHCEELASSYVGNLLLYNIFDSHRKQTG